MCVGREAVMSAVTADLTKTGHTAHHCTRIKGREEKGG